MEDRLGELLQPAFREVPAQEANAAIARARRERAGGRADGGAGLAGDGRSADARSIDDDGPSLRSYEMVLTTFEVFARELLPKLVYHLESVGAHLPECRGVIISAFAGERLFFLDAKDLIARACRLLGVTPEMLVDLHGTGERRTAHEEPLLLPGPRGKN
jgi:hypothetical protein